MKQDPSQSRKSERDPHADYYASLPPEEKILITLRDELYAGSWDSMLRDLRDRLQGKPYIFRLVNKIEEDIVRIESLRGYERKHRVDLGKFASEW